MGKSYTGKYKPKNEDKYINPKRLNDIVYRSSWERKVMKWADLNDDIESWGSEEVVIRYVSKADGRHHRYFVDFYIKFKGGQVLLVEVKPHHQTKEPDRNKAKSKRALMNEVRTYAVNTSKWEAAREFAKENNAIFQIWTEYELEALGMKIYMPRHYNFGKFKPLKRKKRGTKGYRNQKTKR